MRHDRQIIIVGSALLGGAQQPVVWPFQRAPLVTDDTSKGYVVNDLWFFNNKVWQVSDVTAGAAVWTDITQTALPLDVTTNIAAGAYGFSKLSTNSNITKCCKLWRSSDQTTLDIGFKANGDVDDVAADAFAAVSLGLGGTCEIVTLYDQSFATIGGALRGADATAVQGWNVTSASTVANGGSGMTPGVTTFTVVGTNNIAAQLTGTVNVSGVLTGALTIVPNATGSQLVSGSYTTQLTNPVSVTSSAGGVQPTLNLVYAQTAPQWTANKANGKRVLCQSLDYGAGNPSTYNLSNQGLALPVGFSAKLNTTTVVSAITADTVTNSNGVPPMFSLDLPTSGIAFWLNKTVNTPGIGMFGGITTASTPLTSPSVWGVQTSQTATAFTDNNEAGSVTVAVSTAVKTGGFIGGGNGNHGGCMDMHHMVFFSTTLTAADLLKVKTSSIIVSQTTTQTRTNLVVGYSDSNGAGFKSIAGNNYFKFLSTLDLLPRDVAHKNLSISGGGFAAGAHNYTTAFAADWAGVYSSSIPRIIVVVAMGVNDMVNGADAPTTFARNQAICTLLLAQGSNVKIVQVTIPPRPGLSQTTIDAYNALVRANYATAIASGGLSSVALIDLANAYPWNSPDYVNFLVGGGTDPHMLDNGYTAAAQTMAPTIKGLLLH